MKWRKIGISKQLVLREEVVIYLIHSPTFWQKFFCGSFYIHTPFQILAIGGQSLKLCKAVGQTIATLALRGREKGWVHWTPDMWLKIDTCLYRVRSSTLEHLT